MSITPPPIPDFLRPPSYRRYHWGTWLLPVWAVMICFALAPSLLANIFLSAGDGTSQAAAPVPTAYQRLILGTLLYGPTLVIIAFTLAKMTTGQMQRLSRSIGATAALLSGGAVILAFANFAADENGGLTPVIYAISLSSFAVALLGFTVAVFAAQQRLLTSVITAAPRVRVPLVCIAMGACLALMALLTGLSHISGLSPLTKSDLPAEFWTWVIISLALIPIQAAGEELVFRGFINQGLARYIGRDWIVFTLSSALFASVHLGNPEMARGGLGWWLTLMAYFSFGYFCCLLTRRYGGIEAAIGLHVCNNLFSVILVGYSGSVLGTPTAWQSVPNPALDLITMLIWFALVWVVLSRVVRPRNFSPC